MFTPFRNHVNVASLGGGFKDFLDFFGMFTPIWGNDPFLTSIFVFKGVESIN